MRVSPGYQKSGRPTITVAVTTYNRPPLLRECVHSILEQEYDNLEILIGNDYTAEVVTVDSLGWGPDPRIRIINHPQNVGAYRNNYFLLREAKGDWFTWLADDDLMDPAFLRLAHEALDGSDALSFFCSYAAAPDPDGVFPGEPGMHGELKIYDGAEFMGEYASRRIRAVGSYGVFKRELLHSIGSVPRFGSGLAVYVDTFIPVVAAIEGPVAYRSADLVFLRTHAGSQSANSRELEDYASAQSDFLAELARRCAGFADPRTTEQWRTEFLRWFAMDAWHVVCKRSGCLSRRFAAFVRYFRETLGPWVPGRHRAIFTLQIAGAVLVDGLKQRCHGLLMRGGGLLRN